MIQNCHRKIIFYTLAMRSAILFLVNNNDNKKFKFISDIIIISILISRIMLSKDSGV